MVLTFAPAAVAAVAPVTVEQKVVNYADNCGGGTHWANSDFTATTTITDLGGGKYTLSVTDRGTFTTRKGAKSPNGSATISRDVTGTLYSERTYEVEGKLKSEFKLGQLPDYDRKNKQDISADKCANGWWKQFFVKEKTDQAQSAMKAYTFDYRTAVEVGDEHMVETSGSSELTGNIVGRLKERLTLTALCRTANTQRWVVSHVQGDRTNGRDFWYGVSLGGGKWAPAKKANVGVGGKLTVWTPRGYTGTVHYYDGYSNLVKLYAKASTKSC